MRRIPLTKHAMDRVKLFLSYSHADEWLKDELVKHLAALKRREVIDVWHDRLIPAGGVLDEEIDDHIRSANVILLLVSNDFMASGYCFGVEYKVALERRDAKEAIIVPVVVRDCDWDAKRLKTFNALPPDAVAVTRGAPSKQDASQRDAAWVKVVDGLKPLIETLKKSLETPSLKGEYVSNLFVIEKIKHPLVSRFDESSVFVDPDLYYENKTEQITKLEGLIGVVKEEKALILIGADRSGKSLLGKKLQSGLTESGIPTIRISGSGIRNADFFRIFQRSIEAQLNNPDFPLNRISILIDDFDDCTLSDKVKENLVDEICRKTNKCIIFSFSNAPSVLFASKEYPEPAVLNINSFTNDKLLLLVKRWKRIGREHDEAPDETVLPIFQKLQLVFDQTEIPKSPCAAVTFLEILESASGADIAFSSFAACYDVMISNRLHENGVDWRSVDECKNFLSLVSYRAYSQTGTCLLSRESFDDCITIFEEQFLSSPAHLRNSTEGIFLNANGKNEYVFSEEYIWYFLCARYVVHHLKSLDNTKYREFIQLCTRNIFEKKYANIVIFIAYFSADNFVLESLLSVLDGLFSKADDWVLSDDTRDIMMGSRFNDPLRLTSHADVEENRMELLREKIFDVINDALKVVARYTLPFLHSQVADSVYVETVDIYAIDADSYMRNVNALMRIHSVIGQILTGRSGTYNSSLVLDCITRMVKASGRYACLNHAIATVLLYDQEKSRKEVAKSTSSEAERSDEQYEKVIRVFSFWSVYISHAGLARYLSQEHSIRALQKLTTQFESKQFETSKGNLPFNFTAVLLIAKLYESGKIDRVALEDALEKYGEHSSLINILRVVFHIYTYYMPISIGDKQWLSGKLKMSLGKLEVQRVKAIEVKRQPSKRR